MWVTFAVQQTRPDRLTWLGILPRNEKGLVGIVTSVFVHGDIGHIASNTLPILVLGMLLFYFYRKLALNVFVLIWLVSGLWLWIGGRTSPSGEMRHIGASTLIYGLTTFLFFSGVFRRHKPLMVVSMLVVFLYGSITWGMFPLMPGMSWEGHLFGAIAGLLVAYNYRKEGPQRRRYEWEDEEESEMENDDEKQNFGEGDSGESESGSESKSESESEGGESTDPLRFIYHYKKKP
jgi:membrane associated rhomboid family serine protease